MKEQFRSWKFKGNLSVRFTDGTGQKQIWSKSQEELLRQVLGIIQTYQEAKIKLTSRQLYYQLVASDIIPNADEIYKRICKFLTDARYAGLVDWEAIEDRGRVPEKHSEWENVKDLVDSAVAAYRLPRWSDQVYYVELYCEKQAMESVLKPIADKYHIYFGYNKGYSSASTMYDLAQRLKEQILDKRWVVVLYLGDHDPSGLDMVRDIYNRLFEFLVKGDNPVGIDDSDFQVVSLALNMAQIKRYNPPPNPAKITDPRAKRYIEEHGRVSWELDALKPEVLIRITERGILRFLNVKKYEDWISKENEQKKKLEEFGNKLSRK